MKANRVGGLLLLALLTVPAVAQAQNTHDQQLWAQVVVTPSLGNAWLVHLEAQPRWSEDGGGLAQFIARTALGRRLNRAVTLWGGHAWTPGLVGPGTRQEHRAWEQLSLSLPFDVVATSVRVRLEQRFLEGSADASHRLRLMLRGVKGIDANQRWALVALNEFMVTFDETEGGPWQGVDQNRLFAGVLRRLSPTTTVEGGYLWRLSKPPQGLLSHQHVAFLWLNVVP